MDDIFERSDLDERAATDEQDVMNKKNRSDGSGSDDPGSADSGSGYTGFVTIESNDSGSDRAGTGVNGTGKFNKLVPIIVKIAPTFVDTWNLTNLLMLS